MDLFRTECKSKVVLVFLLPSLWVMQRKKENTAGQGLLPKAMRRLNNIIRGWGCITGGGKWRDGCIRQRGQDRNWASVEKRSVWKMINSVQCWAQRGDRVVMLWADEANYYSQKNRTQFTVGCVTVTLYTAWWEIWLNQILNHMSITTWLHMCFMC